MGLNLENRSAIRRMLKIVEGNPIPASVEKLVSIVEELLVRRTNDPAIPNEMLAVVLGMAVFYDEVPMNPPENVPEANDPKKLEKKK